MSLTDSAPLVVCLCRYCNGKKVTRFVRRQHSQRYQYTELVQSTSSSFTALQGLSVSNAEVDAYHQFNDSFVSSELPLEVPEEQHHREDTSIEVSSTAQQSGFDDQECDVTIDRDDEDEDDIESVSSMGEKSKQLSSYEQNSTDDIDHAEQSESIPTEQQELPYHVQNDSSIVQSPLYSGASVTLLETLAKHFEWFTSHPGTSKEALSELLCMEHSILPEGNLLPDSYSSAYRLIEPYLIKPQVFHACINDCILFRNEYLNDTECPKCNSPRYKNQTNKSPFRKFIYLPLQPRLSRMFGSQHIAEILQTHGQSSDTRLPFMYDIHDSLTWRSAYSPGGLFGGDKRGLSFAFCTDGANPFSHNRVAYSMWPIMLTLLNLPRNIRNSFSSIFLLGIIPGNGTQEPKSIDPYMDVVVDEFLKLSSVDLYDAYKAEPFKLKAEILLYVLDYPGMGKVLKMCGSGAYKGCVWCEIKGTYCSDLHKMVYLQNRRYLPKQAPLRKQKRGFPIQKSEMQEPPAKRAYSSVRDHHQAVVNASERSDSDASFIKKSTGCKGISPLMKLPNFNPVTQSIPDAMHTVKDALLNLHELMTGKDDTINCRQCEVTHGGRFGITAASLKQKIDRKQPGVPYSLSKAEIEVADSRAKTIITPAHVGFVPGNIFSKTSNLKSHDWKQICSQGILKYCLRGFLGPTQRKSVFMFIDICRQLFAEMQNADELPSQLEKTNLALAQLEKDLPITIQVISLHLIRHVLEGIQRFGPVYGTWMYAFERFNSWMSQRALNRNLPEATIMETYRIYEWCCYMKLSKQMPSSKDLIVTPAAGDKTINLTTDQQQWLHTYYLNEMPEYQLLIQEYMADKARNVQLRKKSIFPSKQNWSPPLRQLSDRERQLLIGPPSSATLLKKVQLCLPNTGQWITYGSTQFQQSARVSCAHVCVSNKSSKTPQFGCISMLFSHQFANRTEIFAMVNLYGDATLDEDVEMWFTPPTTEALAMYAIDNISEPLVVAHDDENFTWFLNYSL